jgi:hypothetical protein
VLGLQPGPAGPGIDPYLPDGIGRLVLAGMPGEEGRAGPSALSAPPA